MGRNIDGCVTNTIPGFKSRRQSLLVLSTGSLNDKLNYACRINLRPACIVVTQLNPRLYAYTGIILTCCVQNGVLQTDTQSERLSTLHGQDCEIMWDPSRNDMIIRLIKGKFSVIIVDFLLKL